MKKLKLLFAYDHELPLGGAKSFNQGIFEPTDKLIKLSTEINVPITLFTDILSFYKFREWGADDYCSSYTSQIKKAMDNGHDVQLHIHAQWLDTEFKDSRFYPSPKYTLSDFEDSKEFPIEKIVSLSRNELNTLCLQNSSDYKCIAYRAGGLALFPSTKSILTSLYDNGIRLDSSIVRKYYWKSSQMNVNYRNIPKLANWTMPIEGPYNANAKFGIFEIPIASMPKNFITNLPTRFKRKKYAHRAYDCGSLPYPHKVTISKFDYLMQSFSPRALSFDFYTMELKDLIKILEYNIKLYKKADVAYLSTLSHPKLMGDYALGLKKEFVSEIRKNYAGLVEFTTFRKVYEELGLK